MLEADWQGRRRSMTEMGDMRDMWGRSRKVRMHYIEVELERKKGITGENEKRTSFFSKEQ